MEWRSEGGLEWLEARLPGARAAFSTRLGGVSEPPHDSLNLGLVGGDGRDAVLENRRRLCAALGLDPARVAIARQVHGAELLGSPARPGPFADGSAAPQADGHLVAEPGDAALVFVADCLPVVVAGPRGAAVLHCGWRGLAAGILARGAAATEAEAAAVGPGIGPCCYPVGEEVVERFAHLDGAIAPGGRLDLRRVARLLLRDAGVERVEVADHCTSCEPGRFFSHRRDEGRTGRQAGLAWLEGD